jgi:endonuclease/exonuclease/phosphatase family metal-dependent hydrolase
MSELRVLTWNVRSLRDDVDAIAAVVRECAPDVMAVQEAPRFARWRSKRAALARRCGLLVATADRPGGLVVFTTLRTQVDGTSFTLLPKTPRHHQRAVATASVTLDGASWCVASVHLSTDPTERQRQLPSLLAALPSGAPLVVAGDVNEGPVGPVFRRLASRFQDCFVAAGAGDATGATSPSASPVRRIDAIFADPAVTVVSCQVVDTPGVERASDHRPVLAVLRQEN